MYLAIPHIWAYFSCVVLSPKQREVVESIATIGKQDIPMKELASRLGLSYRVMMRYKEEAMKRNGYTSWDGFLADFVKDEL